MITSIRLRNFKGFRDATLRFGPFTILVGANATGKSNIRDALRFLHGVARGYSLAEIIGGRHGTGGQQVWEPIRGGPNEIIRIESQEEAASNHQLPTFSMQVNMDIGGIEYIYKIEVCRGDFAVNQFRIASESLRDNSQIVYETHRNDPDDRIVISSEYFVKHAVQSQSCPEGECRIFPMAANPDRPILPQIRENQHTRFLGLAVEPVLDALSKCRFLEFSPDRMRIPSFPGTPLGERGENLPSVLNEFCFERQRKSSLLSWISELTSTNIQRVEFRIDFSERVHLVLREGSGKSISAYSISDGTLKFLAMAATLLSNSGPCLYVFEDIGCGIHSSRLYLLADLFERNTYDTNTQVFATTHSSALLGVVNDRTFEHISVACRLEESDTSIIRSITALPNVRNLRTSHGLSRLMSGGWMETTLNFMDDREE